MIEKDMILAVTEKLVAVYNPITIYLFGSYAWGTPNEDSDIDIMVIVKESNEKSYKRMKPAYVALRELDGPRDIFVYTIDEFEKYVKEVSSLCYKIKEEGVKLYEAS
jgi:predicted nucleotidyltransferase